MINSRQYGRIAEEGAEGTNPEILHPGSDGTTPEVVIPPIIPITPEDDPTTEEEETPEVELSPDQEAEKTSQEFWREVFRVTHETAEVSEKEAKTAKTGAEAVKSLGFWEALTQDNPPLDKKWKEKITSIGVNTLIGLVAMGVDFADFPLDAIQIPGVLDDIVRGAIELMADKFIKKSVDKIVQKLTGDDEYHYSSPISKLIGGFPLGNLPLIGEFINPAVIEAAFRIIKEVKIPVVDAPRQLFANIYDESADLATKITESDLYTFISYLGGKAIGKGLKPLKVEFRKAVWDFLKSLFNRP